MLSGILCWVEYSLAHSVLVIIIKVIIYVQQYLRYKIPENTLGPMAK